MSQIRKLAGGGSTTWGKFTKDGVVYDLNDETVRNNVLNKLQATAGEYGDFYEQLLAPLRNGEDRSGDSISNRTDLISGFSNVSDKTNANLLSTNRTTKQKRRDARRQNDTWISQNAIKNFLNAFTPSSEEAQKNQEEIDNSIRTFEYDTNGGFSKDSVVNAAIKNRLKYYYDYISDNDVWNKAYRWSSPIDKQRDSDLKLWFDSLGTDYLSRRNAMEDAVNKAISEAESANSWNDVSEKSKRILSYFNIGVEKGSNPISDEDSKIVAAKKKWTDAGYNDKLYDSIGNLFELDDEGNLHLVSGQTFNLGDWHNGRNIYFNDDFYNSDLAKTGIYDALRGYTYYNGQLYKENDPRLARILNSENGYNALMRAGNFTGADAEIMTRFTNAAKENPGILQGDKYSSFLASNPNYRFQNLTGLVTRSDTPLNPGEQIIQYVDLDNPDVDENNPYVNYTYKYRLLDADGNDLGELDPSIIQDITNGQVQDFTAYNRVVGTNSPYDGMYYKDYEDLTGKKVPIRIYRDPKDENNVILNLPSLNAAGVKGGDIKLPANVAKIILGNKNLIAKLAGNSQNMANFQNIISRLVQSAARPKNGIFSYITPIDFFTSERRQLEKMGFSPEEAEDLWDAIEEYAKSAPRSERVLNSVTYTPIRKLGGKINYIEKLANGGRSGGTTNAKSTSNKVNIKLQNPANAAGLFDIDQSNWTKADSADVAALVADLGATGIMLADPTNIGGALAGAAGSLARFRADTLRHQANPDTNKGAGWNLAANLSMDAVGIIPVIGDAASAGKAARAIRKSLPTILKLVSLAGMGDAAATAAKKIANGEKWTVRDLSLVVNAVTSGIAMSRMGGFGKSSKTTKTTKITTEKVKIGNKEQTLDKNAIRRITSNSNQEEALKTELKRLFPDASDEAIAENASKLLKEKKSIWQGIRGKNGKMVLDTAKVKGKDTTEINAETPFGKWWRGQGEDRAAYLARLRGENPTKVESRKGTMWTREDIAEAPGTTPGAKYYKDEFGTFYRKGDVSQKPITAEEYTALEKTRKSGKLRSAINDEAGNFTGKVRVSADRPFAFDAQGKPVFTETVTYASPWRPMAPHILAPFHTHTDYTYPILPDYNPEIPVSDLTYAPYIAKKGGIVKAQNGLKFRINPITGKPESTSLATSDSLAGRTTLAGMKNFKLTTPTWNPNSSNSISISDYTQINNPTIKSTTKSVSSGVIGPGGAPLDAEITDGNNRLFNPELPISAIRLAGILGGADKRWPKVTAAPQQGYLNVELARSDSPALQAQANSLREQLSNWRKATTSDNIQNNALKMQNDARVMDALRENTARQSQLEWETNLHNAQLRNSINEENNRIAYQNAQARDAKEMARNQFEAAKETEKQASIQQALYELQARLSQDQQYRSAINTKEYADKLNAGFDKYLANLSQTDWDKWNTLTPEQQYDYGDFRNYLAKVNPTVYANNRMMIEKRYKDMSDAIQLSQLRGRANFPVLFNKKGGRVNGNTRYTLEPDERIWIDNNKAAHAKIAKLNDNAIKLLLRALK